MRDSSELPPVFIVGAPRSGTTILVRTLRQHSQFCAPSGEPRLIWRYGNDALSDFLLKDDAVPSVRNFVVARLKRAAGWSPSKRLIEKTPSNSVRMGFVNELFPDCLFIHVVRDGRSAIPSICNHWEQRNYSSPVGKQSVNVSRIKKRFAQAHWAQFPYYTSEFIANLLPKRLLRKTRLHSWGPRLPGLKALRTQFGSLGVSCLQWRLCVEMAQGFGRSLPSERYMEVRLEDLNEEVLDKIHNFCGLKTDPNVIEYFRAEFSANRARGCSNRLSDQQIAEVLAWTEPTLRNFGYL